MRLLVVGAGATGGYFGGRLAAAGRDVTFLVRSARAKQLAADGLRIISPHGDATLTPKLVTAGTIAAPFDAVVITVKAYSLAAAIEDFAPAVGPDTVIVPALNGMRHMDVLAARFGAGALVGGLCKIAAALDPSGAIKQLSGFHDFVYGERDGNDTARIRALDAEMVGVGFDARLSSRIESEMWEKWVMMATLGGVTCLMRGAVGEIEAAIGGREFVQAFLDEVVAAVSALGHVPGHDFVAALKTILLAKNSALAASMYRDLVQGNPIEADQIIGDLLARAAKAGVKTPLLATAYAALCVYQNRLAATA
ncbi:2-dehydropantoate 2-reductase [Rhizomicrobium electricum]|jgi:2-dehydropantoate 2-reductase|uniref:2-dehydropantoate 2-reductase n=1 Tax=Rhizomicrobium electricum TaxID=480070 RepID=A0ABP3P8D2_9PROT|nr:2-dehydropantoate 2-reductase [Rhizomicrobium electricum]NIJ48049.1 2-dehydropantoate 2-reductase [Rhizomicrobium electricum]